MRNFKLQPVARHEFIDGVKKTLCKICQDKDCENCKHMKLAEKFPVEVKK